MTHILVVDDSFVTQLTLVHVLEREGHTAHVAEDGHEALRMLERQQVNLVITDISMPGMDGLALLSELRDSDAWCELPVILITGTAEQLKQATGVGADEVLTKPVSSWQVATAVNRLLHSER